MKQAEFSIGEVVKHKLFNYYGVIYDVDPVFMGSAEWYLKVAKTCPPKDQPWYRVLVDGYEHETYVAQRNLIHCKYREIHHPMLDIYFDGHDRERYTSNILKT